MKKLVYVVVLVFFAAGTAAGQQPAGSRQLTLTEATRIALEQNVGVKQAANNVESAENSVFSAYSAYFPQPYAYGSFVRSGVSSPPTLRDFQGIPTLTPRTELYYNRFETGFGIRYTIFDGFNREAGLSSARSRESQAVYQYERTRQLTVFNVEFTYLNVLRNEQLVKVAEENLKRDRRQLERITESNRVGASSIADVYRQQSIVANDEVVLISAQNTYDKSKADLLNLLALDPSADYTIADPAIDEQVRQDDGVQSEPGQPYRELLKRALESRRDYLSARSGVDLAESGVTQAWSTYYPTVSLSGGFSTNAQNLTAATTWGNRASNVGLNLSWQLPEVFGSITRIQNAKVTKYSADLTLEQKERDVSVELKKALLDLEAAKKQKDATQKALLSAEQDRRVAEERYNLGAGTLLDLYTANANYVNAQANNVNANYNFIISKRNLEYMIGDKAY